MFVCPKCKQEKKDGEYYLRKCGRPNSYCKDCNLYHTKQRQQKFKYDCVQYKGGKCCKCGYDKCLGSLHFHHRDPNQKDFTIGTQKRTDFEDNQLVKTELDKCDLLCANCHGEQHYTKLAFIIPQGPKEPKEPKEQIISYCGCGNEKLIKSQYCSVCFDKNRKTKIQWPTKEELEKLVWEYPTTQLANKIGVSDKAIDKRCKKLGLSKPSRGYWTKLKSQK